jgi:hypothetical protein
LTFLTASKKRVFCNFGRKWFLQIFGQGSPYYPEIRNNICSQQHVNENQLRVGDRLIVSRFGKDLFSVSYKWKVTIRRYTYVSSYRI